MFIAKIVGNVVATRKSESLIGYKLMIIQPLTAKGENTGRESVAADYVGAGIGEIVLVGSGSSVRVEESKKSSVIDLAIIGIIDELIV
ncbi:MAG: EutN/CcmL family microcompartment protein [Peptoniphilus sp.]|uniref:Carbon dioxide concentrating mechanism protein CcmL n=2 Tax=Peptoniphilus indolicus TaxID=33030 RepID=G4D1U3_9FIRM|nr:MULTISPECIES: EutN/CcmL family microcompartment protein [Peptoniphilus]EGY80503.1 carbon dioxide concentrating mechanism protein CcmL [Peptoniphilus indolicus ATCC 29427]MDY2987886.1 EutN/CcmL family microcompartment protein [Peptoniphilus sp.]SUB75542.1 Carbon dioxide concentrating mechanism protein CcmL [Peptoniphilus indolicus]